MAKFTFIFLLLFSLFLPQETYAHGIGQQYNLPLPLWLYLASSGAVVGLSFLLLVGFFRKQPFERLEREVVVRPKNWYSTLLVVSKVKSTLIFSLFIATAFLGTGETIFNFAPTYFWAIFIVAIFPLAAILGNFWQIVSPFVIIIDFIEKIRGDFKPFLNYPRRIALWPSVFFYFSLIWLELASPYGQNPRVLGLVAMTYLFITVFGSAFFSKDIWLSKGEFFNVLLALFSKIAPVYLDAGKVRLRIPFVSLTKKVDADFSQVVLIILTLSGVVFDSFAETPYYFQVYSVIGVRDPIGVLPMTFALLGTAALFLYVYLFFVWISTIISKSKEEFLKTASAYSFSLLPIALGYFIAHYYTLLLTQGQWIIKLASDPFGFGWDLFGTGDYRIIYFLQAKFVWYSQIGLIVTGHVIAVFIAHILLRKKLGGSKRLVLSEYPITALMIVYTVFSLWLLSQPIVISPR